MDRAGVKALQAAEAMLVELADREEGRRMSLPEGLCDSQLGERLEECAEHLWEAVGEIGEALALWSPGRGGGKGASR